jgi:hypothetical protein
MWPLPIAVRATTFRFAISLAMMLLLPAFTPSDFEKAKIAKDHFKDKYWKCLATAIVQKEPTNISIHDFSIFIKGACRQERDSFFGSLIKYMGMLHPEVADDYSALASTANIAVAAAINDAVKVFADRRTTVRP